VARWLGANLTEQAACARRPARLAAEHSSEATSPPTRPANSMHAPLSSAASGASLCLSHVTVPGHLAAKRIRCRRRPSCVGALLCARARRIPTPRSPRRTGDRSGHTGPAADALDDDRRRAEVAPASCISRAVAHGDCGGEDQAAAHRGTTCAGHCRRRGACVLIRLTPRGAGHGLQATREMHGRRATSARRRSSSARPPAVQCVQIDRLFVAARRSWNVASRTTSRPNAAWPAPGSVCACGLAQQCQCTVHVRQHAVMRQTLPGVLSGAVHGLARVGGLVASRSARRETEQGLPRAGRPARSKFASHRATWHDLRACGA